MSEPTHPPETTPDDPFPFLAPGAPAAASQGLVVLVALSAPTHGWFRSRDAEARGVSPSTLNRFRNLGLVETPMHGINHLTCFPDSWDGRALAAVWAAGPHAALGRWAALRVLRGGSRSPEIDIVMPRPVKIRVKVPGLRHHTRLEGTDIVVSYDIPVTSVAFTICDLAAVATTDRLVRIADRFIADDTLDLDELRGMVRRFRAIEGVDRCRAMLDQLDPSSRWTRSDGERAWARLIRQAGVPAPVANLRVIDTEGRRRYLDFAWPDLRLAVELNLHPSHGTTIGRGKDGRRQNDLDEWRILHFDLTDLMTRPDYVVRTVKRAIARAERERGITTSS